MQQGPHCHLDDCLQITLFRPGVYRWRVGVLLHIDEMALHPSFIRWVTSLDFVMSRFLFGCVYMMSCVSFWSVGFIDDSQIFRPSFEAFMDSCLSSDLSFEASTDFSFELWPLVHDPSFLNWCWPNSICSFIVHLIESLWAVRKVVTLHIRHEIIVPT